MKYGVKCQITIAILIMLTFSLLVCAEEGLPNMRLRLEMEGLDSEIEIYLIDDKAYVHVPAHDRYMATNAQVLLDQLDRFGNASSYFKLAGEDYEETVLGMTEIAGRTVRHTQIVYTPTEHIMLEEWVDEELDLPLKIKVIDDNGDIIMGYSVFELELDPDITNIDMDKYSYPFPTLVTPEEFREWVPWYDIEYMPAPYSDIFAIFVYNEVGFDPVELTVRVIYTDGANYLVVHIVGQRNALNQPHSWADFEFTSDLEGRFPVGSTLMRAEHTGVLISLFELDNSLDVQEFLQAVIDNEVSP